LFELVKKVVFQEYVRRFEKNVSDWFPSHYNSQISLEDIGHRNDQNQREKASVWKANMEAQKQEIARLRNSWKIGGHTGDR